MNLNINLFLSALLCIVVFSSCTFEQNDDTQIVVERVDILGDTIAPWGTLIFKFNIPLIDDKVNFIFYPNPGSVYSSSLNDSKDTLFIQISGLLKGNTEYVVSSLEDIEGENGTIILKEDINFTITTHPLENEPNDDINTSDLVDETIYGQNSSVVDFDFYKLSDSLVSEIRLINHSKKSGFNIVDSNGIIFYTNEGLEDTISEVFSSNSVWPMFIKVFSLVDSDSRYQLEVR